MLCCDVLFGMCAEIVFTADVASSSGLLNSRSDIFYFPTWNKNQKPNTERREKQKHLLYSQIEWNMSPTISASKKAAKSTGRQTNNSLSSVSGHVVIEHSSTSKSNDSKQSNSNASNSKANESKKPTTKVPNNAKAEKKASRNSISTAPQKAASSSV